MSFGCLGTGLGLSREWKMQMKPQERVLEVKKNSWVSPTGGCCPPPGLGHERKASRKHLHVSGKTHHPVNMGTASVSSWVGCVGYARTFHFLSSRHCGFQSAVCTRHEDSKIFAKLCNDGSAQILFSLFYLEILFFLTMFSLFSY